LLIAVIDDHDVIHSGIRVWCATAEPEIRVAKEYLTADAFLTDHPGPESGIDAVVVDLELRSRQPAFDDLKRIIDADHCVVVYSHLEQNEIILRCLDLGAATYLAKSEGKSHLLHAIRAAAVHEPYIGPRMAAAMGSDTSEGRPKLSAREIEVLKAWFQTDSKEVVARRLHLEPSTIKSHLQRIRAKYAAVGRPATTKAKLVARALQDGLIGIDEI
jgi:DNA-binding NarL/FixJ family response regulator